MSITLYGLSHSRSFRCLWALEEAKLEFDYVSIEFGKSEGINAAQGDDYRSKNWQGKVPTLVDGNDVLTESGAILTYVNHLSGGQFIPSNERGRTDYDRLAFFVLSELEQPLWSTGKHRFAIPEEHRVVEMLETAKWEFTKAVGAFNDIWNLDDYVLGEQFSFADILVAQTINWADRFKFDLDDKWLNYRDRMYSRGAALAALSRIE